LANREDTELTLGRSDWLPREKGTQGERQERRNEATGNKGDDFVRQ